MFVLSLNKFRVGTALSADWLRPFALKDNFDSAAMLVNQIKLVCHVPFTI